MPNQRDQPATEGAMADLSSPRETQQANRDLSQEREASETALANLVAEAVAREMSKAHGQYTTMMKEFCPPALPTTLKVTSGMNGFKLMDPFDWTKDRNRYQCWQLWYEKAKHALKTMDGDSEDNKISCFHHWINTEG